MARTAFVTHHDCSRHDTGWGSPEHQGRLPAVARAVYRDMLTLHEHLVEVEGRPVSFQELSRAHDPAYLERLRGRVDAAAGAGEPLDFENGTLVSGATWDAVTAAAGCAITAVDAVLEQSCRNAFCAIRPPGSGAGFARAGRHALVNHAAVAARHLRERREIERVLVIEWGERPGRGTAEILAADPGCRYLTVHAREPEGEAASVGGSVPVPAGADGATVRRALAEALERVRTDFVPDFVLLSAGFDILAGDPLGSLSVNPAEVHDLTGAVTRFADEVCQGRLVSLLEGGYDPPATGRAVALHLRALAGVAP